MNKENWKTIVFALEQYIQEIENEGSTPTPHIYETLTKSVTEMGEAK